MPYIRVKALICLLFLLTPLMRNNLWISLFEDYGDSIIAIRLKYLSCQEVVLIQFHIRQKANSQTVVGFTAIISIVRFKFQIYFMYWRHHFDAEVQAPKRIRAKTFWRREVSAPWRIGLKILVPEWKENLVDDWSKVRTSY